VGEKRRSVVVVGSGFGGSVMAYRLALKGYRVTVLERGRAWPGGSFPRSLPAVRRDGFWDPDRGLYGLFDIWSFRSQWAIVASGLGGGSLLYANVIMRMPADWFETPAGTPWPITYSDLAPHYAEVEKALGAVPFPPEYLDTTDKAVAFRRAAGTLAASTAGLSSFAPKIAVAFAAGGAPAPGVELPKGDGNLHGTPRYTCTLCGECDVGCNKGSKHTLDYTYLSAAQREGADIRTLYVVKALEPRAGGGWRVRYVDHTDARRPHPGAIEADRVVVSAGALGSTYLLLRSRDAIPEVSARLGHGFSGNGDFLTFAPRLGGTGVDPSRGPVITSALQADDGATGGPGFFLEDGGYPAHLGWLLQGSRGLRQALRRPRLVGTFGLGLLRTRFPWIPGRPDRNQSGELGALLGGLDPAVLPLLGMGRDEPDGVLRRGGDGKLDLVRPLAGSRAYYDRVRALSKSLAQAMGAGYEDSLFWRFNLAITVHPLGGCAMGETRDTGVVSPMDGHVWGYDDLHVADGSVMPGPVGANPSLTIAAVAHRFADGIPDA
jgi:cholesterol oxidase